MSELEYLALGRVNTTPLDLKGNSQKILELSKKAYEKGFSLLLLPELVLTGFNCGDMFLYPHLAKSALTKLLEIQKALPKSLTLGLGLPLLSNDGRLYDAYVVLNKDNILAIATPEIAFKATDSRAKYFSTGKAIEFNINNQSIISNNSLKLDFRTIEIAYDNHELDKADLVFFPEASRYELNHEYQKEEQLLNLSKKLNTTVARTNLLGCESGSDIYDGFSIIAHNGNLISRAKLLDFKRIDLVTKDTGVCEYLNEYDTIIRAVALGLFDWMLKTYSKGFALSMSGGADSALCAVCTAYSQLAALNDLGFDEYQKLLSKLNFDLTEFNIDPESYIKNVVMPQVLTTVYQGSAVSGSVTRTAAFKVSENIGAKHFEWSIAKLVEDYTEVVNSTTPLHPLNWEENDLTLQNIQARSRAPGIWMIANRYNKLLMTTCNASEEAVGYCTMDGDTAGGVAPIADISKSRVLKINAHIANNGIEVEKNALKLHCPNMEYIVKQEPTAELKPGGTQTDEKDLMPYVILDRIHAMHQEELLAPKDILNSLANEFKDFSKEQLKEFVIKYFKKLATNQWKRERGATSFHIEKNDLNAKTGFIFPLLNDGFSSLLEEL